MASSQKKYSTLVSNTLLFAISNFSSKLLSFFIRPYLSYALDTPDIMGVSSLLQQATNLLIPVVSLGVSYAVIRFGLDKKVNKSSVFVNGGATISVGFLLLLLAIPLVRLIPNAAEYLPYLYLCVLASCLRTLCTQFIRSRMLNRLVAIDGVLTTGALLAYYLVFLSWLKLGAAGFLLANACADLTSMVFVFFAGRCYKFCTPKAFDKKLWRDMLRYCLPMIPAAISFWIINASDMFFVQAMCEDYGGRSGNYWVGLLSAGYFLPQVITILGSIFYEAWQLSAVTEEEGRARFFTKIFRTYSSVLFCCAAGIIWLCRPVMHVMKSNYYYAWHFVPFLTLSSTCSCFNQFLNSAYVVNKKSTHSLWTMLAGAVSNCIMNYFFIKWWGPIGATVASFFGLGIVFVLRALDAHNMIGMSIHPGRVALNFGVLAGEALLLLAEPPLYGLWTGLLTAAIILFNFAGVWAMARMLLPKLLGRRGRALVSAVDNWIKK